MLYQNRRLGADYAIGSRWRVNGIQWHWQLGSLRSWMYVPNLLDIIELAILTLSLSLPRCLIQLMSQNPCRSRGCTSQLKKSKVEQQRVSYFTAAVKLTSLLYAQSKPPPVSNVGNAGGKHLYIPLGGFLHPLSFFIPYQWILTVLLTSTSCVCFPL